MSYDKEYVLDSSFLIPESILTLGSVGFCSWLCIKAGILAIDKAQVFIFSLLFFIFVGSFIYIQINIFLIQIQYYRVDKDKRIVISADNLTLNLSQNASNITIHPEDVLNVEIYEGKPWGRLRDFDYLTIQLTNNEEIIITQFIVPKLINDEKLNSFLKGKPTAYFKKRFNYIEANKL